MAEPAPKFRSPDIWCTGIGCRAPGCSEFHIWIQPWLLIEEGWDLFRGRCPQHTHVPRCPPLVPRPDPQLYSVHMLAYRTEAKGKEA